MDNKTLTDIFNKAYERFELKKFIKEELFKAINEDKWITIHPHGEDSEDYKRLLIKEGETVEDAMHRQGYYNKRKVNDEKPEEKLSKTEKYNYQSDEDIEQITNSNFNGKTDLHKKAFKNAYKEPATDKIIKNINKLGKLKIQKVGLDKGSYIPSIMGEEGTIKADSEYTFYHEFAHSIDHRLGKLLDKGNPQFNWLSNELTGINKEIIKKLNYTLPADLENKFKELSKSVKVEFKNKYADKVAIDTLKQARDKYKNFDNLPLQLKQNIIEEISEKIVTKNFKDIINSKPDYKKWSVLSDIYSALTMGRDSKNKFLGTHSQEYWEDAIFGLKSGKSQNVNSEIFANYVEMRMGNFKEQLKYLKTNEPKLYKQLDLLYNKVAEEMEKL